MTATESVALVLGLALLSWRDPTRKLTKLWKKLVVCAALTVAIVYKGTQALLGLSYFLVAFSLSSALVKNQRRRALAAGALVGLSMLLEPAKQGLWEWIVSVYMLALTLPLIRSFAARHAMGTSPNAEANGDA